MGRYSHRFVETYRGPLAFGLSRKVDEASLIVYLQKFSDDQLMEVLRKRLSNDERVTLVDFIMGLLRKHLTEEEYHRLFLKGEE
jgi:hypothetical protein